MSEKHYEKDFGPIDAARERTGSLRVGFRSGIPEGIHPSLPSVGPAIVGGILIARISRASGVDQSVSDPAHLFSQSGHGQRWPVVVNPLVRAVPRSSQLRGFDRCQACRARPPPPSFYVESHRSHFWRSVPSVVDRSRRPDGAGQPGHRAHPNYRHDDAVFRVRGPRGALVKASSRDRHLPRTARLRNDPTARPATTALGPHRLPTLITPIEPIRSFRLGQRFRVSRR